jgi:Tfp pilus assembly protein PilF
LWLALGLSLSGLTLPVFEARIVERARLAAVAALGLGVCAALYVFVWRPVQSDLQLRGSFAAPTEGDGENAILQAEAAVAAQPCRVEALYRLAVLLERSGQHEARLGEVLLRVKKLAPDYRAVNGKAGRWLCRQGKIADGIPFLEREVALDAGIPVKQEIRAVYAEDRFWLARAYLDTGQREQACRTLQEAQRFDPENPRVKELLLKHCRGPNAASP